MALTNLTTTNFVQSLVGIDAGGLFRLANDGDVQALSKVAGPQGEGGPDYVFTGNTAGAETVNFTVTFATLLKLYAAQQSGVTRLVIKAKVSARSVAVATSGYWEEYYCFDDIAGTMTIVPAAAAQSDVVSLEGAATTNPAATNSGSNTLQIAVATLAAAAVRIELYVNHVQ